MKNTHNLNREEAKKLSETTQVLTTVDTTPATPEIQMAQQLTAQYHRATGGMLEVLKFGVMLSTVRESLMSARGHKPLPRGTNSDGGIKAWLEKHCPEINRQTAYRLESVTKSVQEEYAQIVGAKVAKQVTLTELVMTPTEKLPESVRSKQLDLFDYVKGTSQRSWLDKLAPAKETGGKTYDRGNGKGAHIQPTHQQKADALKSLCTRTAESLKTLHESKAWAILNDAENDGLIDHLEEVLKGAKSWRKMSQSDRDAALMEALK